MTLRFDGKVAIVTGAGGGLGKEYAKALASRGCKVVVNDLGGSTTGSGSSSSAADNTVEEIKAAGGEAVANYDNVIDGDKIVQTAIDAFGRVDIVINNAGILRDVSFRKMTDKDWELIYQVHSLGPYKVARAAWPHMEKNGYGRIINVSSPAGLYGNFGQANYSAMKRAAVGFTLSLAKEGAKKNIKAHVLAPIAMSRMTETVMGKDMLEKLPQSTISNLVVYLSHDSCEATGGVFELGGKWISKLRWQRSKGVIFSEDFTAEDVAKQFDAIGDYEKDSEFPDNLQSSFGHALSRL